MSGNMFLYTRVTVCCLWVWPCFYTFHRLFYIGEVLWSQRVLQVGKQVVVARNEIKAVRRVVRQLSVEMLHQCSSVSSWHALSWRTTPYVSIPHLLLLVPLHSFCNVSQYKRSLSSQAYKNLFHDMTGASVLVVNILRSRLSIYIFLVYNKMFFSLLVLLTADWGLLSE
jgi:hypothetical protein